MSNHYNTEADIMKVVNDFELCRTGKDDFHHVQHLVVATAYLDSLPIEGATGKLRDGLVRFLEHHEIDKQMYNETLTVFWLEMVALALERLPEGTPLVDRCNSVIDALSNPKLASEFYSDELLWSEEARAVFVDPDLKKLEIGSSSSGELQVRKGG